jgi:hypothetical protein
MATTTMAAATERAWAELLPLGERGWSIRTTRGGIVAEARDGRCVFGRVAVDLTHNLRSCRVLPRPDRSAA